MDDVPEHLRLLEAVLAPRGCDVVSAPDRRAALEPVESANPDLALPDVVMPQNGAEVLDSIRGHLAETGSQQLERDPPLEPQILGQVDERRFESIRSACSSR